MHDSRGAARACDAGVVDAVAAARRAAGAADHGDGGEDLRDHAFGAERRQAACGDSAGSDAAGARTATAGPPAVDAPTAPAPTEPAPPPPARATRRRRGTAPPRPRLRARRAAAAAEDGSEDRGLQADGRHHRQDDRERRALAADGGVKAAQPGQRSMWLRSDAAPRRRGRRGSRAARGSRRTASRARARARSSALARLEDERLDLLAAHAEHRPRSRSWDWSPSSKRTSAARWSSGRRCSSSTRSRRSARRWTWSRPARRTAPRRPRCRRRPPASRRARRTREAAVARDRVQPGPQLDRRAAPSRSAR